VNVTIPGDDLAKAEGDRKIIGLVASKMETATLTCHDDLATMFFGDGTGNNSKDFDGLLNGCDDGSTYTSYGGITRGTSGATWWQAQVNSTGGALTVDSINALLGKCTIGQKKPDLAFMPQNLYDKLWSRVQPQQRFLGEKSVLAQVGFTGINLNGHCECLVDNHCPSGYIFFMNTDYWKLILNRKRNFYWTPEKTPVDADAWVRQLLTMGDLINVQPRVSGLLSSLS
jgi:hypothetical protein